MKRREWIEQAVAVINRGVELMPLHHLAQWEGVRGLLELSDQLEPDCDCIGTLTVDPEVTKAWAEQDY